MRRYWRIKVFGILLLMLSLVSHEAYGYLDPGTTSSIFSILAPMLAGLLTFLGFLFRPFKKFLKSIIEKVKNAMKLTSLKIQNLVVINNKGNIHADNIGTKNDENSNTGILPVVNLRLEA